jgi:hypothetical protein
MDLTSGAEEPTVGASRTRRSAGRIVAFLAVLVLDAAGGWQAGQILDPPVPIPTFEPASSSTHDHPN